MRRFAVVFLLAALRVSAETPEDVVTAFMTAIGNRDAARANVRGELEIRCLEISSLQIVRTDVVDDKATVDATAVIARTPRGKGRRTQDLERIHFELKRENGAWRIASRATAEELLAEQIRKAPENARALVAAHPELVGPQLVHKLIIAATTARESDYRPVQRELAEFALALATAIDDRGGIAYATATLILQQDVPGANRAPLLVRAKQAFEMAVESGNPEAVYAAGYMVTALILRADNSSREGDPYYLRTLEFRDSMRDVQVAVLLTNMGQSQYFRQDYAGAYRTFQDVYALEPAPRTISQIELNLGWIMEEQNEPASAMEHFRKSVDANGPKPFVLQALLGIARMHRAAGREAEALAVAQKALQDSLDTPFKGLTSASYALLTEMQIARGEKEGATETLEKALQFAREAKAQHSEMLVLLMMGNLAFQNGNFDDALRRAREAEVVWRSFESAGSERYPVLMLIARSELALGHRDEALAAFGEAIDSIESVRETIAGGDRQKALYFEPFQAAYGEMVDLLLARGRTEDAFVYAERGKGRALLDTLGRERKQADALVSEGDRAKRRDLVRKLGDANRKVIVLRSASEPDRGAIETAVAEQRRSQAALDAFDRDLGSRDPRLRAVLGDAAIIQPAALGELVTPEVAVLEYVVRDNATTLFLVERNADAATITTHRIDIPRAELDRRVRAYADALASRRLDYAQNARALYDLLVAPAAARIASKRVLCVVPDGALWHLPFESLIASDGKFLIERSAVFYVPSISVYREMSKRPASKSERPLVAFGNPAIGEAHARVPAVFRDADLGPLPDAETEVNEIRKLWGAGAKAYTGRDAREDVAKREMSGARIVHFAAHGLFDDDNPMFSQIVLARGASDEDGVLQAWELMRLDIAADLVVLSACETARGHIGAGEGLIGMSWALFAGGCPSTIATQWKIGSRSTSDLMVAFHRRLASNSGDASFRKARALQGAQIQMLRQSATAHPFYWAAFVLIGSGS